MRKPFLRFLLSFFINYVAMSIFYLRDKSFNEDKNHRQYTIGTALIELARSVDPELFPRADGISQNQSPKVAAPASTVPR